MTVYNVDFIFYLAVLPRLSMDTSLSDAGFKDKIWKMYLGSQGWSLKNDVTIASQYFQGIQQFNTDSAKLADKLKGLTSGKNATVDDWNSATSLAIWLVRSRGNRIDRLKTHKLLEFFSSP